MHVYQKAVKTRIGEVFVATEDKEIFEEVVNKGGKCILTEKDHSSGTDRIFEAYQKLGLKNIEYIIKTPKKSVIARSHKQSEYIKALRENDIIEWIPQSPIYIFHGIADELVPYENSQMAYDYFVSNNVANIYFFLICCFVE